MSCYYYHARCIVIHVHVHVFIANITVPLMCVVYNRGQVGRLQLKCRSLEVENTSTKEQIECLIGSVEVLTTERDGLMDMKDKTETEMKKKLEVLITD